MSKFFEEGLAAEQQKKFFKSGIFRRWNDRQVCLN
jgi:hypothetical protein